MTSTLHSSSYTFAGTGLRCDTECGSATCVKEQVRRWRIGIANSALLPFI